VSAERLRFDFAHPRPMTADEIARVEDKVNAEIRANTPVSTRLMTPDAAIEAGAMALFGEKYGDEVRVLSMGRHADQRHYSVELCGGTHVGATGEIGLFRIIQEAAVAAGVRRIEAVTGEGARRYLAAQEMLLRQTAAALRIRPDEVPERVAALADTVRRLERDLAEARHRLALAGPGPAGPAVEQVGEAAFSARILEGVEAKALRGLVDEAKGGMASGVAAVVSVVDGRAAVAVGVTEDLTARVSAVDLVRVAAAALGGQGGGGRPDMAQAGGPDGAAAPAAIAAVRAALEQALARGVAA